MKQFIDRHRLFLFFVLSYIVAEILVNPIGEFPLNDDWCYTHIVVSFDKSGQLLFGNFPSMSLATHILWGWLMTKLLGFSFFTLRLSTMIAAVAGCAFLNKLIIQVSGNKILGLLACVVLMYCPIFFSLTNTYMTDVTFNTLAIICFYFLYNYFKTENIYMFWAFVVCSAATTLVRQYGASFPAAFFFAVVFSRSRNLKNILLSLLSVLIVTACLKIFESYLEERLPEHSSYKFSGKFDFLKSELWQKLAHESNMRYKETVRLILIYTCPFALLFVVSIVRKAKLARTIFFLLFSATATWFFFLEQGMSSANIFSYMNLGPETFYETFRGSRHNHYPYFEKFITGFKFVMVVVSIFVLLNGLSDFIKKLKKGKDPLLVFFLVVLFSYVFMIFITDSFFDRYYLLPITIGIVLLSYYFPKYSYNYFPSALPLLLFVWICVAGTKDYLEWNRQRWDAYRFAREELHAQKQRINGGFEVNCWNEGDGGGWRDFSNLENFDYLIQFNKENNFEPVMAFPFQRYFPYTRDRLYVFAKKNPPQTRCQK
jgi:hypothetical protein